MFAVNGEHPQAATVRPFVLEAPRPFAPHTQECLLRLVRTRTLLQEVKSDVKDSSSLPFVTKHPGTWKKTSQLLTLLGEGGGGRGGDFVKLLLLRPRQSNDGLSKFGFLDLPSRCLVERAGSCIIFHQHLVAFTGSALLWCFTS